ncbi:MAG TPA: TRAP transporter large permease subunit [Burkholderiales bacterium]|nr:TRAP transporter large permease subunit [Burkholderiales bacterium]
MSDPALGLTMLLLIVVAIMMGFPTAFTMMGLGMLFGYVAFWRPDHHWLNNEVFDLFVQRTYGAMNNETLLSIPLFVFMGYVIERAALVDKMFFSVQLAFRRLPASLAVTTLLVCAFWGIASGIVGAVVVLMGVIALRPMLAAGYDVRLASGVITAGGTLGILIPPSVMLIVYAAVAGQSIVKLYAAAMLPGFFLTALYLIYIVGWAMINPKIAPKLPPEKYSIPVPEWLQKLQRGPSQRVIGGLFDAALRPQGVGRGLVVRNLLAASIPLVLTLALFAAAWWYVVIHNAPVVEAPAPASAAVSQNDAGTTLAEPPAAGEAPPQELGASDAPQELGSDQAPAEAPIARDTAPEQMGTIGAADGIDASVGQVPEDFYLWFWGFAILSALVLAMYYWRMDGEQLEILKMLADSVVPLGVLTFIVLAVILFGITTASESAGIGAVGSLYLAGMSKYARRTLWASLVGLLIGGTLGFVMRGDVVTVIVSGSLGALFAGTGLTWGWDLLGRRKQLLRNIKESTFLTAKTTAMVCWLFVGSALFSAVFALHGGQQLIERWVLSMNLSPLQFMILAQAIIFLLGWPLEWTEIIVIFVPIFIPLLAHFQVDPILFGTMVAVNLQAAFLSPPVAMSAFYLKGVAPKHVTLNQIFAGMMPYMGIVILCLAFMYIWPGMTLWLPQFLYGR